jgi:GNAT superfamily N-acetyltransferase
MTEYSVVELEAHQTYPLRLTVLRSDTPTTAVAFDEDDWPGTVHLGVRGLGEVNDIVAVSTWIPKPYDQESAVQLRGMATAPHVQGHGVGGLLVESGCSRAAQVAPLVWARARDTALGFYLRHGFTIDGAGFIDDSTGKPHHLIVRRLTQS